MSGRGVWMGVSSPVFMFLPEIQAHGFRRVSFLKIQRMGQTELSRLIFSHVSKKSLNQAL